MNRAQRRAKEKERPSRTEIQLAVKREAKAAVKQEEAELMNTAINQAALLLFVLPMEVLMNHYWTKPEQWQRKIPEFTEHLLNYYNAWEDGELDMEAMKKDLWEYGGIRLEEVES